MPKLILFGVVDVFLVVFIYWIANAVYGRTRALVETVVYAGLSVLAFGFGIYRLRRKAGPSS